MWKLDHEESWAPKNWCFWTVVLEKTLENPLDCKEIKLVNPKTDSLENTLMLGKIKDKRRMGWQRIIWLDGITSSMDMNLSKSGEIVKDRACCHMGSQRVRYDLATKQLKFKYSSSEISWLKWFHLRSLSTLKNSHYTSSSRKLKHSDCFSINLMKQILSW